MYKNKLTNTAHELAAIALQLAIVLCIIVSLFSCNEVAGYFRSQRNFNINFEEIEKEEIKKVQARHEYNDNNREQTSNVDFYNRQIQYPDN